ncbi:MAG: hypothetical protein IZT56_10025 [Bacteroidetes bacterium]|nr:hypothetical protein [Bacteroidota bacterium]
MTTVNSANAEVVIGSDNCVCKPNDSNRCLASNFISYRTKCGTGATDSDCEAQQTSYPWGGTFCTDVG